MPTFSVPPGILMKRRLRRLAAEFLGAGKGAVAHDDDAVATALFQKGVGKEDRVSYVPGSIGGHEVACRLPSAGPCPR